MQYIMGIFIVALIILFLFQVLLPVMLITFLLNGVGVFVGLSVMFGVIYCHGLTRAWQSNLARLLILRFDGRNLIPELSIGEFETRRRSKLLKIVAWLFSATATLGLLYSYGASPGAYKTVFFMDKPVHRYSSIALSYLITIISLPVLLNAVLRKIQESGITEKLLLSKLNKLVSSVNIRLQGAEELELLCREMKNIAMNLRIYFPVDYLVQFKDFVEEHKVEFLKSTERLESFLPPLIREAKEDHRHLVNALTVFEAATVVYRETAVEANKTGSPTLIRLLDDLSAGMEVIKGFLTHRAWDYFQNNIDFIVEQLALLRQSAENYQHGATNDTEAYGSAKPYEVLGVTEDANDDEIHRVYVNLSKIYHPDTGIVRDPEQKKMKEINEAHDEIRRHRRDSGVFQ